jgi:hypothetical protein
MTEWVPPAADLGRCGDIAEDGPEQPACAPTRWRASAPGCASARRERGPGPARSRKAPMPTVLELDRSDLTTTHLHESPTAPLAEGQVRVRVDCLAVTANTVTYALAGDLLRYWAFFPTDDDRWGRVPAMGWADVVESTVPGVAGGMRVFGWFPLADEVVHRHRHTGRVPRRRRPPSGPRPDLPGLPRHRPRPLVPGTGARGPPRAAAGPVPHRLPGRRAVRLGDPNPHARLRAEGPRAPVPQGRRHLGQRRGRRARPHRLPESFVDGAPPYPTDRDGRRRPTRVEPTAGCSGAAASATEER